MIARIHLLMHFERAGTLPKEQHYRALVSVHCRECGDVTRAESGGTVEAATMEQADLYTRRHLAKHLTVLAEEITKFTR